MTTPVNLITWLAAALPIMVLLYLLIIKKWAVVDAAILGVSITSITAFFIFKAPLTTMSYEITKGVWNSLSIIAVILPAIFLYELSLRTRAYDSIQAALTRLIPDKYIQVLAIGWCFASFLQGPSGFGVPIAVTAPILIGIGIKPFYAVLIPLVGHAWAGTYGTLALGWQALVQQTFLANDANAYLEAASWTTVFTGLMAVLAGFVISYFYGGFKAIYHGLPAILLLGAIISIGQYLTSQHFSALSAVLPTTLALGAVFLIAKLPRYQTKQITSFIHLESVSGKELHASNEKNDSNIAPEVSNLPSKENRPDNRLSEQKKVGMDKTLPLTFIQALLPYLVLVIISVIVLLIPSVKDFLTQYKMSFAFPETQTAYGHINTANANYGQISWLTHSGFFLLLSALLTTLYYAHKRVLSLSQIPSMLLITLDKSVPPALSIMLLLVMSKLMTGSNQIGVLAAGTASVTGAYYAFFAPVVGTIGTFMSSSNVSSNILLAQFQSSMANITGQNPAIFLAAQTSGGALGTMISPSNLLLGVTTAGIVGAEGSIIKKLLPIIGLLLLIVGTLTQWFS
ncbi:L-lactate permease [Thorsellia kenyensis]|uniref:L-lactate permease n=1 Tax=Thorsellia kenyensis TaxID=1549888 RepID=A0ABV6CAU2_9GAMM